MDNLGWIKLHRKLLDNPYMRRPAYLSVWMHLLLHAQHDSSQSIIFKGERIMLRPGQLACGRKQLSEWTGVSEGTVQRILKTLKNEQQIEQQTSSEFRLITILNWGSYQKSEQLNEQPVNNERTTSEQPVNTIQECKKIRMKEEKKESPLIFESLGDLEEVFCSLKENRKNLKKPMTPVSEGLLRKKILKMSAQFGAKAMKEQVELSIENGWSGVFPPKGILPQKHDLGKEERDRKADEALRKKVAEREIFISQNPQYKQ